MGDATPLVCDASSDFLSRPVAIERYGVLYACAQKNAGPAGVTVAIIRDDVLERRPRSADDARLPQYAENGSLYNTPPVFAIYVLMLVTRWLRNEIGGLEGCRAQPAQGQHASTTCSTRIPSFYRGHAEPDSRSLMNVTFRLPDARISRSRFLAEAAEADLVELKGHRSVGGIRASIYNAMPLEGVEALRHFMTEFVATTGER